MSTIHVRHSLRGLKFSPTLRINEQVAALRAEGHIVYHMGFGESPFPVHPLIQEAIGSYSGKNQYLPAAGLLELRERAKRYILTRNRIDAGEYEALIGPGSKELIFDVQLAIGGDLLFPAPSWVSYIPQTLITRDEVVKIALTPAEQYKLSAQRLERAVVESRAAGRTPTKLILNYPNNPTGMTYTAAELAQIAEVARAHGILVISDEIYSQVTFEGAHTSIAQFYPEGTIVTTGLSKHLSLGGFRVGVALVPKRLREVYEVLRSIASETFSAVSTPVQYGVLKAFEENTEIEQYIAECTRIHDVVTRYAWRTLRDLGVAYAPPQGGFYLYPDFGAYAPTLAERYGITTSEELATRLLQERYVATLPSTAFGDEPHELRLRLSTVDFDGLSALVRFRDHGCPDEDRFVAEICPRVALACQEIRAFFGD